jgi:hypothetical protein
MSGFNPAIADAKEWKKKTLRAIEEDIDRNAGQGFVAGYAIAYFDPMKEDLERQFSFSLRTAHAKEYMDEDAKNRLQAAFEYIMKGVEQIFQVDAAKLEKWRSGIDEDDLSHYIKKAKLH